MKHTFLKVIKIATGTLLSSLLVFSTIPVSARSTSRQASATVSISPTVKYVGTDSDGASLVSVSFESPVAVKFEVSVSEGNGYEYFSREFEGARFQKVFKLVNTSNDPSLDLEITIRMKDTGKTHAYNLSTSFEEVAAVSVSKL